MMAEDAPDDESEVRPTLRAILHQAISDRLQLTERSLSKDLELLRDMKLVRRGKYRASKWPSKRVEPLSKGLLLQLLKDPTVQKEKRMII